MNELPVRLPQISQPSPATVVGASLRPVNCREIASCLSVSVMRGLWCELLWEDSILEVPNQARSETMPDDLLARLSRNLPPALALVTHALAFFFVRPKPANLIGHALGH